MAEPPKLASAILNHLVQNEALAGDLREAYVAGKSGSWYWGQVLAVVWRTASNAGRASFWWSAVAIASVMLVLELPFLLRSSAYALGPVTPAR